MFSHPRDDSLTSRVSVRAVGIAERRFASGRVSYFRVFHFCAKKWETGAKTLCHRYPRLPTGWEVVGSLAQKPYAIGIGAFPQGGETGGKVGILSVLAFSRAVRLKVTVV